MGLIPEPVVSPWERTLRKLAAVVFEALQARANRYGGTDRAEQQRLNKRVQQGHADHHF